MNGLSSLRKSASGALGSMIEQRVQMALGEESVSVKHLVCCALLFNGRRTRLILLRVAVNHGSTFVFKTTLHDALGANAAAEAGNKMAGMAM